MQFQIMSKITEILSNEAGLWREVTCHTCKSCLKPGKEGRLHKLHQNRLHKLHQNKWQDGAGCFGHQDAFLGRGACARLQVVLEDSMWKGLSTWSQRMAGRLQRRVSKAGQEDGEQEQPRNDSTLAKSVFQGIYLEKGVLVSSVHHHHGSCCHKGDSSRSGAGISQWPGCYYWWGRSLTVRFSR